MRGAAKNEYSFFYPPFIMRSFQTVASLFMQGLGVSRSSVNCINKVNIDRCFKVAMEQWASKRETGEIKQEAESQWEMEKTWSLTNVSSEYLSMCIRMQLIVYFTNGIIKCILWFLFLTRYFCLQVLEIWISTII